MQQQQYSLVLVLLALALGVSNSFSVISPRHRTAGLLPFTRLCAASSSSSSPSATSSSSSHGPRMGELTPPEQQVFDLMNELHQSGNTFRFVVVGKAASAILETTVALTPSTHVIKLSQSPSTGANLMTLASNDQSFEFHLQLSQISKVVFVEKETPKRVMRIVRLLNETGDSIASLILVESEDGQEGWFKGLIEKHGSEMQL